MSSTTLEIERVLDQVEDHIAEPRGSEYLSPSAVEAIDVVYHALTFTGHPRGLDIWRTALWQQQLEHDGRAAVATMLTHLADEAARGNANAAAEICDCLSALVPTTPVRAEGGIAEEG